MCTYSSRVPRVLYTADLFQQVELRLMELFTVNNETPILALLGQVD